MRYQIPFSLYIVSSYISILFVSLIKCKNDQNIVHCVVNHAVWLFISVYVE